MLVPLLLGSVFIIINMGIQSAAVVLMIRYLTGLESMGSVKGSFTNDSLVICVVLTGLFAGHILQFVAWAALFIYLGEFVDFNTAFYHSIVNFSSLGYGDIVMSEKWRLLGAFEACNGVLMLGLSAGTLLAVISRLFSRLVPNSGNKNS